MRILIFLLTLQILIAEVIRAEESFSVGAILGLSGNVARYGEWGQRGITLALDEVNSSGRKIKVIYEDTKGQPALAVSAYKKLRSINKIKFILTFQSSVALAIAPLANRDKVIQIDFSATTPMYSSPDDYTFRTGIVATQLAKSAAADANKRLGLSNIAALYIENDFGLGMFDVFNEHFKGKIVNSETFRADEADYRPQLLRVKESSPQAIWLVGHLRESGLIIKQARELGINTKFLSDVYSIEGSDFIDIAGNYADGTEYLAPALSPDSGVRAKRFFDKHIEKYSEQPNSFTAQAYDAVFALALATEKCPTLETNCVKDELYKLHFEGASGVIDFDKNGDVKKPVRVKIVNNMKFMTLSR